MIVLIVEDNPSMRRLIRHMVAGVADEISECDDGAAACSVYGELRPDWVLMDIELGQINGITATRRIKADFPEARIIIVTSYDAPDLREAAREAGAMDYVVKDDLFSLRSIVKRATKSA
ncbi:MAG TPA: response regulator [Blastocatellia bacterium]|nr:response regulator [Blastocatellia bacterium]